MLKSEKLSMTNNAQTDGSLKESRGYTGSRKTRRYMLPRFFLAAPRQALEILPPRYDTFFAAKQAVLLAVRGAMSFAAGDGECVICGTGTGAVPVCKSCLPLYDVREFFYAPLSEKRCGVCGKILISEENICMRCRTEKIFLQTNKIFPLFSYRLWNKRLLFDWKIIGNRALSPFFAERLRYALFQLGQKVIVPVPPRHGKIKELGWDQIEELSVFLEHSGFAVCKILERLSKTEQKKLGREGRLATVGAAYRLKNGKNLARALKKNGGEMPEEVCLVDDVITTGATIESCAGKLKEAGVKTVNAVTLFCVD